MKREFHLGPGAASLMLIVVVVSLSVLSLLGLMSARSDEQLSRRSVAVAQEVYALDVRAEQRLMALDNALVKAASSANDDEYLLNIDLPEGMMLVGRSVSWREEGEGRWLDCAVELAPMGEYPRTVWTMHRLVSETGMIDLDEGWLELWN